MRILTALCTLVLVAVLATPANAGNCTGPVCGRADNAARSTTWIMVSDGWPAGNGSTRLLNPGQKSPYRDTDGIYIRPGCRGSLIAPNRAWVLATGWNKITDLQAGEVVTSC